VVAAVATGLLLACFAFAAGPDRVERWFVEGWGPPTVHALSSASAVLSTSMAEWVELFAALGLVAWSGTGLWRLRRAVGRRTRVAARLVAELWSAVALVVVLFHVLWGFAYSRPRIERRMGFTEPFEVTDDELDSLANALVTQVNDLYLLLHQLPDTTVMTGEDHDPLAIDAAIDEGWVRMVAAEGLHPSVAPSRGPTKPLLSSGLFTWLGIGGMYFPFTGEANINHWAPGWQQPHTHAHEMAHQRMFASENEANFAGFLATIYSDDPLVRYSGWLFAQRQVLRAQLAVDPSRGADALYRRLPGVQTDVNLSRAFWTRYDGSLSDLSSGINDLYLKANNVEGGIRSYGLSVRLLVRWARRCGALPEAPAPLPYDLGDCDPIESL
jgi:hypothetical protein